jgi:putative SOS response-associated peptidase YedK
MRWGLIPHWVKGSPKSEPINARCETAATSGMFRQTLPCSGGCGTIAS